MKVGQVVNYKRAPQSKVEHCGIIIEHDVDDKGFFSVFDPTTNKIYDVFKTDLSNSSDVITFQNTH